MVEEAIRNGTWVPPSPGGLGGFGMGRSGRDRVDLDKKPKMWEAFVEKKEDVKGYVESEWDWDSIRPFSATVATSPAPSQPPPQPIFPPLATTDSGPLAITYNDTTPNDTNNTTQEQGVPFTRRIRQLISPAPSPVIPPLPERNIQSNVDPHSSPNAIEVVLPSGPQKIRVSVLIVMPSPPHSPRRSVIAPTVKSSSPSPSVSPPSSPSPMTLSLPSSTPLTPPSVPQALALESSPLGLHPSSSLHQESEDEKVPYIELGVAEFLVREEGYGSRPVGAGERADSKRCLSIGSSLEAV